MNKYQILFFVLFFVCSCNSTTVTQLTSEHEINFDALPTIDFFSADIFSQIEYLPLETTEDCLLSDALRLKMLDNDFYILDYKAHHKVFRFSSAGQFLNTIGQRGKGPHEYTHVMDFAIDTEDKSIDLLIEPQSKIFRYHTDGSWVGEINTNIPAQSFAKMKGCYVLNISYSNYFSKERLYKIDEQGQIITKFHPITTKLVSLTEPNFFQTDTSIIFHESFSNIVYEVSSGEAHPLYQFDFGEYDIPSTIHEMESLKALDLLNQRGMRTILRFCENKKFAHFAIQQQQEQHALIYNYLFINKENGHCVILQVSSENSDFAAFGHVAMITENDELVFLVHPYNLVDLIEKYSFFKGNISTSINEDMNPFIAKIKLKPF
ncbi:MAG: 6-bladed beta-propeller [Bacteroidales bacterium]|jgi:hypothetical protein|nr:6-bladed beta-propeller [Bacteroidales bacterium]